jgi:hypothetical protein
MSGSCDSLGVIINVINSTSDPINIDVTKYLTNCNPSPCIYIWDGVTEWNTLPNDAPYYTVQPGENIQFNYQCGDPALDYDIIFLGGHDPSQPTFSCDFTTCWKESSNQNQNSLTCSCTNSDKSNAQIVITQSSSLNQDNPVVTILTTGEIITSAFTLVGRPYANTDNFSLSFSGANLLTFSAQPNFEITNTYAPFQIKLDQFFIQASIPPSTSSTSPLTSSEYDNQSITGNLSFKITNKTISLVTGINLSMQPFSKNTKPPSLKSPEYISFPSSITVLAANGGPQTSFASNVPYAYVAIFDDPSIGTMTLESKDDQFNFTISLNFATPFSTPFTSVSGAISLGALAAITINPSNVTVSGSTMQLNQNPTVTLYATEIACISTNASLNLDATTNAVTGIVIKGSLPQPKPGSSINQPFDPLQGFYSIKFDN